MLLALILIALACSLLAVHQVKQIARDIRETRDRIDRAELFIADCINPDGDAIVIRLVGE